VARSLHGAFGRKAASKEMDMAQINVERKTSGAWVWLLVGLILFAAVVWILVKALDRQDEAPVGPMGRPEVQSLAPAGSPTAPARHAPSPSGSSEALRRAVLRT
jgi:hypothetical protein